MRPPTRTSHRPRPNCTQYPVIGLARFRQNHRSAASHKFSRMISQVAEFSHGILAMRPCWMNCRHARPSCTAGAERAGCVLIHPKNRFTSFTGNSLLTILLPSQALSLIQNCEPFWIRPFWFKNIYSQQRLLSKAFTLALASLVRVLCKQHLFFSNPKENQTIKYGMCMVHEK